VGLTCLRGANEKTFTLENKINPLSGGGCLCESWEKLLPIMETRCGKGAGGGLWVIGSRTRGLCRLTCRGRNPQVRGRGIVLEDYSQRRKEGGTVRLTQEVWRKKS